jgi:hypothetical protein
MPLVCFVVKSEQAPPAPTMSPRPPALGHSSNDRQFFDGFLGCWKRLFAGQRWVFGDVRTPIFAENKNDAKNHKRIAQIFRAMRLCLLGFN